MKVTATPVGQASEPTQLTDGWHPAYVAGIVSEPKPEAFTMMSGTHIFRWHLLIWEDEQAMEAGAAPEKQSGISSTVFNEKSKSHEWVRNITGTHVKAGEDFDFDDLSGYPCLVRGEPRTPQGGTEAFFRISTLDRAQPGFARRPVPAVVTLAVKELRITSGHEPDDIPDPQVPASFGAIDDDLPI